MGVVGGGGKIIFRKNFMIMLLFWGCGGRGWGGVMGRCFLTSVVDKDRELHCHLKFSTLCFARCCHTTLLPREGKLKGLRSVKTVHSPVKVFCSSRQHIRSSR